MPVPYVPVPNTAQAELRFTILGEPMENVLYFEGAVGIDISEMTALGEALWDWWSANMKVYCHSQMILREVYVTDLTTQTSPTVTYNDPGSEAGTAAGEPMPNSTSLVVSFRSINRGRSGRGRNYVAGAVTDAVLNNTFTNSYVTGVLAAYTLLNQPSYIPGWTQVVVSRFTGGNPRAVGLKQIVQSCIVTSTSVKTQRNRLPD